MARRSREELRRSAAAAKGWETRRANERAQAREAARETARRSAAAARGWETRRQQERAEAARVEVARQQRDGSAQRRSEAAKKGWETRRAKERATERRDISDDEFIDDFGDWEIEIGIDYEG